jgi:hypothetical protein
MLFGVKLLLFLFWRYFRRLAACTRLLVAKSWFKFAACFVRKVAVNIYVQGTGSKVIARVKT